MKTREEIRTEWLNALTNENPNAFEWQSNINYLLLNEIVELKYQLQLMGKDIEKLQNDVGLTDSDQYEEIAGDYDADRWNR
jgi:hypothetical protein